MCGCRSEQNGVRAGCDTGALWPGTGALLQPRALLLLLLCRSACVRKSSLRTKGALYFASCIRLFLRAPNRLCLKASKDKHDAGHSARLPRCENFARLPRSLTLRTFANIATEYLAQNTQRVYLRSIADECSTFGMHFSKTGVLPRVREGGVATQQRGTPWTREGGPTLRCRKERATVAINSERTCDPTNGRQYPWQLCTSGGV